MHAIVQAGGKQFRVAPGDVVRVPKINGEVGSAVLFSKVLAVFPDEGEALVGSAANGQKITGKKDITGDEMRRGLESLQITAARWKELGLDGFAAPFQVTCDDHNGHNSAYVQQWDGAKWVKVSDWIAPMKDKVVPLINKAAEDYVSKNAGWPKRTEACDKSS